MNGPFITQKLRDNGALDSRGRWIIGSTHRQGGCWEGELPAGPDLAEQLAGVDRFPWLPAPLFESDDFIARFDKASQYFRARRAQGLSYSQMYRDDHLAEAISLAVAETTSLDLAVRLKDKIVDAVETKVRSEGSRAKRAEFLTRLGVTSQDLLEFPYRVAGENNRRWRDFISRHLLADIVMFAQAQTLSLPFPQATVAVQEWAAGLSKPTSAS